MERKRMKWNTYGVAILAGILALPSGLYAQNSSGPPGATQDAAMLQRAREYFKQSKLTEAESLCESLMGSNTVGLEARNLCEEIKTRRECVGDATRALPLINGGTCAEALEILRNIHQRCPDYRAVDVLDNRAQVQCPTPQRPPALDEGIALFYKHKYSEAEALFADLQPKYPSLVEIQDYLRKTRVELLVPKIKASRKRGDFGQAKELLTKLDELAPDDTRIPRLRAELQRSPANQESHQEEDHGSKQDALLQDAIRKFYNGDFPRADQLLERYLGQPGKYAALAYFYRGAIVCTDYFLTGAKDEQKQTRARDFFSKARQSDGKFTPPQAYISPKIIGVYDKTATGS
jgi:hypothetical protein